MGGLASSVIPQWPEGPPKEPLVVGYFPGEGIGAEIVPPALELLHALCDRFSRRLELRPGGLIGQPAVAASGKALNDEAVNFCEGIFADSGAILCGPGGSRFVYELRAYDKACPDAFRKALPVSGRRSGTGRTCCLI